MSEGISAGKQSVLEFTDQNFTSEVLESDRPVLVDFWAAWCGPCRILAPTVHELAESFGDRAKVGKVDVDSNPSAAATFGISSIPTVLVFQGGKVVDAFVGVQSAAVYSEALEKHLTA